MATYVDDSIVKIKGLTGTGRWSGLNDRFRHGPEQLSQDAQLVLSLALTYRSGSVPSARGLYEAQRDQAQALGQRYMGEVRIKKALQELSRRGFYGIRRESAGKNMIVTLRSYSNLPWGHLEELAAVPKADILKKYFPKSIARSTVGAAPVSSPAPPSHDVAPEKEEDHGLVLQGQAKAPASRPSHRYGVVTGETWPGQVPAWPIDHLWCIKFSAPVPKLGFRELSVCGVEHDEAEEILRRWVKGDAERFVFEMPEGAEPFWAQGWAHGELADLRIMPMREAIETGEAS